jgi:hypothetical protein
VIELQHSAISPAEIDEREVFYHNRCHTMMWVIDVRSIRDHFVITPQETFAGGTVTRARFKWKWYRQSWGSSHLTGRYLDFGDGLWSIESATADGTGEMRSCTYHEFLSMFEESVGYDLPVHWKPTSTGGFIYRFGGGNVILYQQKSGF